MKNPIQPLVEDEHGVLRFKKNAIVRDLLDFATQMGFGLNEMAMREYSVDDHQQFAQLIGYSLSGYGSLSYVDNQSYCAAEAMEEHGISEQQARIDYLESLLADIKNAVREPMARLFEIHPDDLGEASE